MWRGGCPNRSGLPTLALGSAMADLGMTTLASEGAIDKIISRLNISRYRKMLADERNETKRQTLLDLIAEETTKISEMAPRKLSG